MGRISTLRSAASPTLRSQRRRYGHTPTEAISRLTALSLNFVLSQESTANKRTFPQRFPCARMLRRKGDNSKQAGKTRKRNCVWSVTFTAGNGALLCELTISIVSLVINVIIITLKIDQRPCLLNETEMQWQTDFFSLLRTESETACVESTKQNKGNDHQLRIRHVHLSFRKITYPMTATCCTRQNKPFFLFLFVCQASFLQPFVI